MRVKNPLAITNTAFRLGHTTDQAISNVEAKYPKALPVGEAPEPPPLKRVEVAPPGWQVKKVTLAGGSEVTQWFRAGVQRGSMREAWDLAIVEAHETLSAVAGRYVLVEDGVEEREVGESGAEEPK